MVKPRFEYRHQYDEESEVQAELDTVTINDEPSLTEQHHAETADINHMVKLMGIKDGSKIPAFFHESVTGDKFGDFTDAPDFRTAMDRLKAATDAFNELPANIRKEFDHDPAKLMAFLSDPENDEKAVELGLLNKMPEQLPEGVKTRRELAQWAKANEQEALDLGILHAVTPPENPPPRPVPQNKLA